MIDLKAKPFYLKEEDIKWVEETLKEMDLNEKIGQLFCPVGVTDDEEALKGFLAKIKPGGMMYRPGKGEDVRRTHKVLQNNCPIFSFKSISLRVSSTHLISSSFK